MNKMYCFIIEIRRLFKSILSTLYNRLNISIDNNILHWNWGCMYFFCGTKKDVMHVKDAFYGTAKNVKKKR